MNIEFVVVIGRLYFESAGLIEANGICVVGFDFKRDGPLAFGLYGADYCF